MKPLFILAVLATTVTAQTSDCVKQIRTRYSQSLNAIQQQKEDLNLNRNVHTDVNRMEAAIGIVNYQSDYYDLAVQQADNFLRITRTPVQGAGTQYTEVLFGPHGPIFFFEKDGLYPAEGQDHTEVRIYWDEYGSLDTFLAQSVGTDGAKKPWTMSGDDQQLYILKARAYAMREQQRFAKQMEEGRYPEPVSPYFDSDNPDEGPFHTPDLTFFSLQGHVKRVIEGQNETCFTISGQLLGINGQDMKGQADRIYVPKLGYPYELVSYGRNDEGQITSLNMFEGLEEYTWKDQKVVQVKGFEEGNEWSCSYQYNTDGWLQLKQTRTWSAGEDEKAAQMVSTRYRYLEFDNFGNWTARAVESPEGITYDYRIIEYYDEFLE